VRRSLQVAISIGLAAVLLFYFVDPGKVWDALRRCDPRWAFVAAGVYTLDRVLMSYKWTLLLKAQGHSLSFFAALKIYCSAMVWGIALPSTLGADAIRAALIRSRGISWTDGIASMLMERGIGFVVSLVLAICGATVLRLALPPDPRFDLLLIAVVGALLAAAGAVVLSFSDRTAAVARAWAPARLAKSKLAQTFARLHTAYRALGNHTSLLSAFTALTLLEQLVPIVAAWTVAKSLRVDATDILLLAAVPLAMISSRLPLSFDGIGVYEGVFVGVMALAGIKPADALAIALAGRVLQILAWLPWWGAHVVEAGQGLRPPDTTSARR
jgi:uncharacterized protein (TIRG00374 family)